jgi:hypothetical protein
MKPQVLTMTTLASSPSAATSQPPAASRPASSSESTSFRAQPSVIRLTVRRAAPSSPGTGEPGARDGPRDEEGTRADYGTAGTAGAVGERPRGTRREVGAHSDSR